MSTLDLPYSNVEMSVTESGDHTAFAVQCMPAENEKVTEKMEGSTEDGVRQRIVPCTAVTSEAGKFEERNFDWLKGTMAELENIEMMCNTFIEKFSAPRLSSSPNSQASMLLQKTAQITVGNEVQNTLQEWKGQCTNRSSEENQEKNSIDVIRQRLEMEDCGTEVRRLTCLETLGEEDCSDKVNVKQPTMLQQSSLLRTLEGTDDHNRSSLQSSFPQKRVSVVALSDSVCAEDDSNVQHKAFQENCAQTEDVILVTTNEAKRIERYWQAIARIMVRNQLTSAPVTARNLPAKSSFNRIDNQKRSQKNQKVAKEDGTGTQCIEDMKECTPCMRDNQKSNTMNALASLFTGKDNVQTTVVDTPLRPVAASGLEKKPKLESTHPNDHVLRRYHADFSMGQKEKLRGCQHECKVYKDEVGLSCVDCELKGKDLHDETTLLSVKKPLHPSAKAKVVDHLSSSSLLLSKTPNVGDSVKYRRSESKERKVRKKGKKRKAQVTEFTKSQRKIRVVDCEKMISTEEDISETHGNSEYKQDVPQCSGIEENIPYKQYVWEPDDSIVAGQPESSLASVWEMRELARGEAANPESEPSQVCEHMTIDWDEDLGWYCEDCGVMGKKEKLRGCQHLCRGWKDEVGQYCEDCGLTGTDIQKIFIPLQNIPSTRKQTDLRSTRKECEKADGTKLQFNLQVAPRNDQDFCKAGLELDPIFDNILHTHQKEGFNFLARNLVGDRQGESVGCVIAHAPGTGKTCLMISFIQSFISRYHEGRVLILAPKIMLNSWQSEFTRWKVENIPIYCLNQCTQKETYAGDEYELQETLELSAEIPPHVKKSLKESRAEVLQNWKGGRGVLLMSYTLFEIMIDRGLDAKDASDALDYQMCRIVLDAPDLVILDEGHLARTKKTKILKSLQQMRTRRRVIVSGTLFHNNFNELYTLLKLCRNDFMRAHPHYSEKLGKRGGQSRQSVLKQEENLFQEEIGQILENHVKNGMVANEQMSQAVKKLRMLTAPFVHWYPGTILETLPGLVEYSLNLNLTDVQKQVILALPPTKGRDRFAIEKKVLSACIHPSLVVTHRPHNPYFNLNHSQPTETSPSREFDGPSHGVKIQFLLRLLKLCEKSHEKMIIFCSTLGPLNYIQRMLLKEWKWNIGQQVLRLDGTMAEVERQEVIRLFNQCPGSDPVSDPRAHAHLLLASTRACKEGISLVGASRVLIMDIVDNPSVTRQAVSRAFRIGQTKKVFVYRLLTNEKEEVELFHRSVNKEKLSKVLLDTFNQTMTQKDDFLQRINSPSEVEDELLQKLMLEDVKRKMINVVHRYNASGSL